MGGNIGARGERILNQRELRPDRTNTLNGQRPPRSSRDSKPKHGENTPGNDTKVRQIHPKTAPHKDRKWNVQTCSHRPLQCNRNRNQHESQSHGPERLLPIQTARKERRRHLPDRHDKGIAEPVSNVIVRPPSPVLGQNRIQVYVSTDTSGYAPLLLHLLFGANELGTWSTSRRKFRNGLKRLPEWCVGYVSLSSTLAQRPRSIFSHRPCCQAFLLEERHRWGSLQSCMTEFDRHSRG